jgi:hypothetical protein
MHRMRDTVYTAVHVHAAIVAAVLLVLHSAAAVYHALRVMEDR